METWRFCTPWTPLCTKVAKVKSEAICPTPKARPKLYHATRQWCHSKSAILSGWERIKLQQWPIQSPDPSLTEMLWQDFKKAVHKQTPQWTEPIWTKKSYWSVPQDIIFIFKLIKKFGFAGSTCFFYFFNSLHQQDAWVFPAIINWLYIVTLKPTKGN